MSVIVTVNDNAVFTNMLIISNAITSSPDVASFTLLGGQVDDAGNDIIPTVGQEVRIYNDSVDNILFGGIITSATRTVSVPGMYDYLVKCVDYQKLLDRKLVAKAYENMTCKQIIEDLVVTYSDVALGFTTTYVETGISIRKITFNYIPISECIKEMAKLSSFEWYVDEDKNIRFFAKSSILAPIEINDDTLMTVINKFSIVPDYSQIKNKITVRGGYELSDPFEETFIGDGETTYWNLAYNPHEIVITVDGIAKTVGIENLHDETLFDYMMNYYEKVVRCSSITTAPSIGAVIVFSYQYEVPVIVHAEDATSQSNMAAIEGGSGVYEHIIKDETLTSASEAQDRALVELSTYKDPVINGSFSTFEHGFRAGQLLTVNITDENFNGEYIIQFVTIQMQGTSLLYSISFSTVQYTLIDYLLNLAKKLNKVLIREDETIDLINTLDESLLLTDEIIEEALFEHPIRWDGTASWRGVHQWAEE